MTPTPTSPSTLNKAEDVLFRLRTERGRLDFVPIKNVLDKYFEVPPPPEEGVLQRLPHIYSGFRGLDELLGGLQRSDLIILAGRPSMGKTSLALNIARNAALEQGACVALFSLEMSRESLVQRLLASEAEVNSKHLRLGLNTEEEERAIMEAQGKLSTAAIYIDDSPMLRVVEMRSKARRLYYERPLDLIILDYLQLLTEREPHRKPRAGAIQHHPSAEGSGARAQRAAHRRIAAIARRGRPHLARAAAFRPARVGLHRTGRRHRGIHLPRRGLLQNRRRMGA